MSTTTLVPLEEYLHTAYEPDCDYIEGHVEERHVGKRKHSRTQTLITLSLGPLEQSCGIFIYTEQRIRISATRYRIPDICVMVSPEPKEEIFTTAPHLCIEILSSEDRLARVIQRLDDYVGIGVPNIWVIDPDEKACFTYSKDGLKVSQTLLKTDLIELPMDKLFDRL